MATEKRMIDPDKLSKATIEYCGSCFSLDELEKCGEIYVDAVEVVHGRWEDVFKGNCAWARYKCSVCGGYALYRHEQDIIGKWETVQALTAYCPYCGSYMEEGEMNGNL